MTKHFIVALLFAALSFSTNAQYCTAVGPASGADSNLQTLSLIGESSSINFVGCPGVVGLDDQTLIHSVDLSPGNSYQADIIFGTCGGNYGSVGSVWIDYNQDQVFDVSELIGTWAGTPPSALLPMGFTVPLSAVNGTTRMRVVHYEGGSLPIDPCASFTWGSTTDFTVIIGAPIDCSGYIGDDMSDPRIVSSVPFVETHDNTICYTNNVPVYNSPDVFYRLTPQDYGVDYLNVSLCGSAIDTYVQIQDTAGNVLYANDDYGPCAPQSEVSFPVGDHDTLYVVVQGWSNVTGIYDIAINDGEIAGVSEESPGLEVFPNPTQDKIRITGIIGNFDYSIYGINGQLIQQDFELSNNDLDLSNLAPGIYYLEIKTGISTQRTKIIKE